MKSIKNLYVGDVYNRCWNEDTEKGAFCFGGDMVVGGKIELTKLDQYNLYKTNNDKYIIADKYINKPFTNLRLFLASLDKNNQLEAVELSMVDKPAKEYGHDGKLGNFIAKESIQKIKKQKR